MARTSHAQLVAAAVHQMIEAISGRDRLLFTFEFHNTHPFDLNSMSVWHIHQHGDVWHHDINSIIKQRDQRGWVLPGDPPTTPKYATIFTCKAEFILPVTQIETYSRPDIDQLKFSRMENLGIPFSFGEWLKSRRKSLDLTQEELAQRSACSVFALRKIESGERRPSRQLAGLLAAALEIPPDDQKTFIQLARSELKLERLHLPSAGLPDASIRGQKPVSPRLPLPATSLIGREAELAALESLSKNAQCRLLTLTGLGGIGKTRLAVEFASRQRSMFPGGIYFVSLASLNSLNHVVTAIAEVFGLTFSGPANPKEQLLNYLANRVTQPTLLVFDNLEHLLAPSPEENGGAEAVDLVMEILQCLPNVKILATSRERLNLHGEWMFELHGLPVPPEYFTGRLEDYGAVALFALGARRVKADFEIVQENQPALIQICRLLEGIPLAIELAAAWVSLLSCQEIALEIEANLDFLTTSMRDVPERHRSIRATINHSWKLLPAEEALILSRLSVFHGGFSRRAAERVAGASISSLASLHSRSLLHRTESGRYDLHELLRKYALMKLEESPEELENTKNIHSIYYLDEFGDRESDLRNVGQLTAMSEISAEMENIRAAWQYAVIHGQVTRLRKPIMSFWFYDIRGWFQEAYDLFRWTVEKLESINEPYTTADPETITTREHIRANLAWFCIRLGKFEESRKLLHQSLTFLRSFGACSELLNALHHMGALERLAGNFVLSQELFLEMLDLADGMGARWHTALAQGNIGVAKLALGEYQEARTWLQTANMTFREVGDRRILAVSLQFFGEVLRNLGDNADAQACLYESLEISKIFGDRWISGLSLNQLGLVFKARGEYEEAARLFRESLAHLREIKEFWGMLQALNNLGGVYVALGAYPEARSAFCESLSIAGNEQILPEALDALIGIACILMQEGDFKGALALVLFAINHPIFRVESAAHAERIHTESIALLAQQQVEDVHAWKNGIALQEVITEVVHTGRIQI